MIGHRTASPEDGGRARNLVAFGGLLLLGGRLSDLFGAKRIFTAGWAILAPDAAGEVALRQRMAC